MILGKHVTWRSGLSTSAEPRHTHIQREREREEVLWNCRNPSTTADTVRARVVHTINNDKRHHAENAGGKQGVTMRSDQ